MTDELPVLVRRDGRVGRLSLNRPDALHALTTQMCALMIDALVAWRSDPEITIIQIDHSGPRGFCAGGDIRMLAESGAGDGREAQAFFRTEYQLNELLHRYPKPVVALIDGVTMGGGVGISVHGRYRIATERTVFAMPETGIGLFPDVGGGWFLPRLPIPHLGTWLALTGARLKGQDCVTAGVATHFVPTELLDAVRAQIAGAALTGSPDAALRSGLAALDEATHAPISAAAGPLSLFSADSVEEIVSALASDGGAWATAQLAVLAVKSPQTLKVALRQLRAGARAAAFADNMRMEFRIGARVVLRHDFAEGVRAVIIDKDNAPRWSPPVLEGVTDAMLDEIFAPLPAGEEWSPLE